MIGPEFIGCDPGGCPALFLQQLAHLLQHCFGVPLRLHEETSRTSLSLSIARAITNNAVREPAPYALVGNIQTPLRKKILHIPIAQSEPGIEPNGVSNDVRWKAVTFEGDGVHPKRLHRNHQIEIRALNVTRP